MTEGRPSLLDGQFEGREHRLGLRVYYEDTDLSGVVYHANYLRYMERARSDMLRVAGVDQRAAFEAGEGTYAVATIGIRYLSPAKLDDLLLVVSRVITVRAASVVIHQTVRRGAVVLAQADVTVAFVATSGRATRQPPAWLDIYQRLIWQGDA